MRAILAGKYENAIIREFDQVVRPHRNRTTHPYYIGLNRKTERSIFERAGTFLAICEAVEIPQVDWSMGSDGVNNFDSDMLGLTQLNAQVREWDDESKSYADHLLDREILSCNSLDYISAFDLNDVPDNERARIESTISYIKRTISRQHLCRLFMQLREAGIRKDYIIIDERDLNVVSEISSYIRSGGLRPRFAFPNLDGQAILGSQFAGGVFNFAPKDMRSIAAVRRDEDIQRYAQRARMYFAEANTLEGEKALVRAMVDSFSTIEKKEKIEHVFEVVSWIAKPFHYIPGVDAAITLGEDIKDVASALIRGSTNDEEFFLLASKAQDISIRDYLDRKRNLAG